MVRVLTMERELRETRIRTNSLYNEAEKLLFACRDRHDWCYGCQSASQCLKAWGKLTRGNSLTLAVNKFNQFQRELQYLEGMGYTK